MQDLLRLWGFFCWKATKSKSSISNFSFQFLVLLIILGKHLSIQTWLRNYIRPTILSIIFVPLLTLCGKEIKQTQYPWAAEQFEPNFNPCKVNLTHTLGAPLIHSKATFGFSFRFMDKATLPDYRAPLLVLIVVVKFYDLMGTTPRPLIKLFIYP